MIYYYRQNFLYKLKRSMKKAMQNTMLIYCFLNKNLDNARYPNFNINKTYGRDIKIEYLANHVLIKDQRVML